ncbi:hypothetical protein AAC387_Pa06g0236 [Persea americana]
MNKVSLEIVGSRTVSDENDQRETGAAGRSWLFEHGVAGSVDEPRVAEGGRFLLPGVPGSDRRWVLDAVGQGPLDRDSCQAGGVCVEGDRHTGLDRGFEEVLAASGGRSESRPARQLFDENTLDFIFTGGIDGARRVEEFAAEIDRALKPKGFLVVHTSSAGDLYSFNSLLNLFNCCKLIRSLKINGPDS